MRTLVISLFLSILFGCNSSDINSDRDVEISVNDTITLTAPLILNSRIFYTVDTNRILSIKDSIWKLKIDNQLAVLIKKHLTEDRLLAYTMDVNHHLVDSIVLFDRNCYIGTCSSYFPWLKISLDKKICWSDTSYYTSINPSNVVEGSVYVYMMDVHGDSIISTTTYQILKNSALQQRF